MRSGAPGPFGAQLKALREAAGYTQEELAAIAGLSLHAVSALERGERRRPRMETVRALAAALDLTGATRDALLTSARAPTGAPPMDDPAGSLPLAPTALLGRDADVLTLRQWLVEPAARLVTLTGPGGAGKTRLALELARMIAAEGDARPLYVPLAAIRTPAFVASAIAEALGLPDVGTLDLATRARLACADRQVLLVLDNFEQVLEAAPLVAGLLSSAASLRVLTTSRAPLRIRGEREYLVGPLRIDAELDERSPADLARCPAVRLFLERVRDVQPDFRLTSANGPTIAAICRRLDALPLALELAAPWMKALTPEELLRRLDEDVFLPTAGPRDLPERQQTINATVAWSYHLLGPDEQRAFRRLGALPGRFPIEAAAAVLAGREQTAASAHALDAAAHLIDRSLLQRTDTSMPDRPLYQMLETVRAYAALELAGADERDDAMEGLVRYCSVEAQRAGEALVGPAQLEWLNRVRDNLEIYRSALAWLIDRGRSAEASAIVSNLLFFWTIRGHAGEGLRWYEQVLSLPSLSPASESHALLGSGMLRYTRGELPRARVELARARALARGACDIAIAVQAEFLMAHVEHAAGNADQARDLFTRSAEGFRTLQIPWGSGNALAGLAWVAIAAGDTDAAERLLVESAMALEGAGPWFLLLTLYLRAILALRRGNADEAISTVRESLVRIRDLHDTFAFVYALGALAAAAVLKGSDAWAARILGARDAVTERTGAAFVDRSVEHLKEQSERHARARLGPVRWARAYAAGRRTSIEVLLTEIDGAVDPQ
jgi:predicted ATPase/DNA-binding XRE family transcriptional regulator